MATAIALALAGCGGGSSPVETVSAGPGCELSYTLTADPVLTGADPLLPQQWHLRNTGQAGGTPGEDLRALDAWTLTRGAGVRVAVVDDAVEVVHADLFPNLVTGASFSYRSGNRGSVWPLPCTGAVEASGGPVDGHGTAVAGLVLGRDDNALGIAGVAPRASLVAYDALASGQDVDIADALLRDGQANAIYQNSWGSPDDGRLHPPPPSFLQAIRNGTASGRGGLGSVYVFPAGNGGCYATEAGTGRCLQDNSNFDGFVNGPGVIAVCAVDDSGRRPFYGERGANVLVCAPSSGDTPNVTTTSIRGAWRNDFSGTSASTPMVAGVVALMLSANPALSWRDVRLILARTARRNDPTDPEWAATPSGLAHNAKYGFGVVDAAAAVARARTWTSVGGSDRMKTCTLPARAPALAVPDAPDAGTPTPVVDTITVPAGCDIAQVEFVEVTMTATHTYSGDLRVRLRSPSGIVSELANARACAQLTGSDPCGTYTDWTFGSVRHLDEPAQGAWTLELTDLQPRDSGRLDRWSLTIHGR
ncbi:MAG: S8 family peptidase [Burkholderiaceae bacterium]|nr:S8 family serine peptidase [Burkholderiales bacterium]MCZ8340976.1 S8 family peptidase [Burkholderiaceae bacterium]